MEPQEKGTRKITMIRRKQCRYAASSVDNNVPLQKHAYTNILKILPPQCMFLSRNKKNNVYPCKPQFYYIKMGFKGVNIK